jgi:hypothetical protein
MIYLTGAFWLETLARSVRTFAQTLLSLIIVGVGFNAVTFDWGPALGVSAGAVVLCVLTCLAFPKTIVEKKGVTTNGRQDV